MRPTRRPVLGSLFCLTLPAWVGPLCWWLSFTSWETLSVGVFVILTGAEWFFALCAMYSCIILIGGDDAHFLKEKHRVVTLNVRIAGGIFLSSFAVGVLVTEVVIRPWCVEKVLARGELLAATIHDFERANGRPPNSLEELSPASSSEVPGCSYFVGKPDEHDGNPWALRVGLPSRIPFFYWLVYYPKQNYPPVIDVHGRVRRVGTWAAVFGVFD